MNYVSSVENKFFKEVYSLKNRKYRYLNKCYLIEGIRFVQEAVKNNCDIRYIIVSESKKDSLIEKFKLNDLNLEVIVFSEMFTLCTYNITKILQIQEKTLPPNRFSHWSVPLVRNTFRTVNTPPGSISILSGGDKYIRRFIVRNAIIRYFLPADLSDHS